MEKIKVWCVIDSNKNIVSNLIYFGTSYDKEMAQSVAQQLTRNAVIISGKDKLQYKAIKGILSITSLNKEDNEK